MWEREQDEVDWMKAECRSDMAKCIKQKAFVMMLCLGYILVEHQN